jgi:CPA2 family monovalent cation:H+ antiporter-2
MHEMALLQVGIVFTVVAVGGIIANQIRLSVIPFYILGGILLGPYVLGHYVEVIAVEQSTFIDISAKLGIVFLLFFLGLEFSIKQLMNHFRPIFRAGTVDFLVNFPVGLLIGSLFFDHYLEIFLVAGIFYISSSAIITKSLIDLGWISNDESRPILGVLVYEDLLIALYLTVLAALLHGTASLTQIGTNMGRTMGFFSFLFVVVYLGESYFERFLDVNRRESFILRAMAVTVLVSGFALSMGVSEAVAAFVVGMAFNSTSLKEKFERSLEPIRDVFAAIFFFWIGLQTNPFLLVNVWELVVVAVLLGVVVKGATGYYAGRTYGLSANRSLRSGLGLTTRGEFSLIIASIGVEAGLTPGMTTVIPSFAVGFVLAMSVIGSLLMYSTAVFEPLLFPGGEKS